MPGDNGGAFKSQIETLLIPFAVELEKLTGRRAEIVEDIRQYAEAPHPTHTGADVAKAVAIDEADLIGDLLGRTPFVERIQVDQDVEQLAVAVFH